jgi:hypothetical protein
MKTKDRRGKPGNEPGMSLKIKDLAILSGNVIEKTGS